jgi:hypothetical protein
MSLLGNPDKYMAIAPSQAGKFTYLIDDGEQAVLRL